ncbi:glutathione S-transferase N-terminal domain-containing protein [Celerinatantimonas sp. MCCC 1A17872]|uniref:glutathione S-transferase n=1 Tax=Celerinatantimonas sp. MCCC 1A17872 TaxID=3177514 RepID=UPI0038C77731
MYQLYYALTSAYVRKVMVSAYCLGITEQIEKLDCAAHPIHRDQRIASFNPLAKIPAMATPTGLMLYDSRVICEYLNHEHHGSLFPESGQERWRALSQQSLGDGLVDAALLARYEKTARPDDKQWDGWIDAQLVKVDAAVKEIEAQVAASPFNVEPKTIGLISIGCALGYLDFRYPDIDWRQSAPNAADWFDEFKRHPAMSTTLPVDH